MPDILDVANSNNPPQPPPPPVDPPPPAPEPFVPPVEEPLSSVQSSNTMIVEPVEPPIEPPAPETTTTTTTTTTVVPPPPPAPDAPKLKKKTNWVALGVGLLFLMISLPLVYFYSQQQQEIRSRAVGGYCCPKTTAAIDVNTCTGLDEPRCDVQTASCSWNNTATQRSQCPAFAGTTPPPGTTTTPPPGTTPACTTGNSAGVCRPNSGRCCNGSFEQRKSGCTSGVACFTSTSCVSTNGQCLATGQTCCEGYNEVRQDSCSQTGKKCVTASSQCSSNDGACMPVGGSCCTGFDRVDDRTCSSTYKCVRATTPPACISQSGFCVPEGGSCCPGYSAVPGGCTSGLKCIVTPACTSTNGACMANGGSCCNGLMESPNTTCTSGKKCVTGTPACTQGVSTGSTIVCKPSNGSCCSGYVQSVATSVCGSGFKCVAAPTPVPPSYCNPACVAPNTCVQLPGTTTYACRNLTGTTPTTTTTPRPPATGGAACGGSWYCCGGNNGAPNGKVPTAGTSCTNGGTYNGKCIVYHCPRGCGGSACNENSPGVWWELKSCANASLRDKECGQIDTVTDAGRYCSPSTGCDVKALRCASDCSGTVPEPSPTITPTVCVNIKVYKGDVVLTADELSQLQIGDVVTFAYNPGSGATKARFRINSSDEAAWQETSNKNTSNEYILEYTIPVNTLSFKIEGQYWNGTAWR